MALLHVALTVLTLLSAGHSAPVPDCASLTQPIDIKGREQLLGSWKYLAGSTDMQGFKYFSKILMDTVWAKLTAAEESDVVRVYQSAKMVDQCFTLRVNMTLGNNKLSMTNPWNSSTTLVKTSCPDCLVLLSSTEIEGTIYRSLELLSHREKVSPDEMEEYKKQVYCLNLPQPNHLDSDKGFCPDESSSQNSTAIDVNALIDSTETEDTDPWEELAERFLTQKTFEKLLARSFATLVEYIADMWDE